MCVLLGKQVLTLVFEKNKKKSGSSFMLHLTCFVIMVSTECRLVFC